MKHFFTSVNNAYIPKAAVLVESLRRVYGSEACVWCMLSDSKREDIDYSIFDRTLTVEDLDLPVASLEAWIFSHTVVELCTAVKPFAFKKIFRDTGADNAIYMDPDTVLYTPMDEVYALLPERPVMLTPHVTVPAIDIDDLLDGEMLGCLRHGVFNLGFLALADHGDGRAFLDWWAARCLDWCYDDGPRGLFTDQRWIDLAPCFFDKIEILRHPGYNTATWNLYYREIGQDADGRITVNGAHPLRFFHFSGFDIGTHEAMLRKHAPRNATLRAMTDWYVREQQRHRQEELGCRPGAHDLFPDGARIEREMRVLYRESADLRARFRHPRSEPHFREWYATHVAGRTAGGPAAASRQLLRRIAGAVSRRPELAHRLRHLLPPALLARIKRAL